MFIFLIKAGKKNSIQSHRSRSDYVAGCRETTAGYTTLIILILFRKPETCYPIDSINKHFGASQLRINLSNRFYLLFAVVVKTTFSLLTGSQMHSNIGLDPRASSIGHDRCP